MNYVEINGVAYDVIVTKIQRSAETRQSENAGTTLAKGAEERLDPLGTFISHIVTFKRRTGKEAVFDALWDSLIKPRYSGVPVKIVYNQQTLAYEARFEVQTQDLQRIDEKTGKVYWGAITVTIIPTKAQGLPV